MLCHFNYYGNKKTIMLSTEQYKILFAELCRRTSEYIDIENWLPKNVAMLRLENVQTVLSIGGGIGLFDNILKKVLPNFQRYVVIEPNLAHIEQFKQSINNDRRFEFHQKYFEESLIHSRFDLAVLSHCLYYMDRELVYNTLKKYAKSWIIFHQSEYGINEIQQLYGNAQTHKNMYSSKDIKADLERHQLPYQKYRIDSIIDVSAPNENLINFFLEKETSQHEQQQIIDFLNSKYPNGKMYHPGDVIKVDNTKLYEQYK